MKREDEEWWSKRKWKVGENEMKRGRRLSGAMVLFEKKIENMVLSKTNRKHGVVCGWERERKIERDRSRWRGLNISEWKRERRKWRGWEEREGLG